MKPILFLFFSLFTLVGFTQSIDGSWRLKTRNGLPVEEQYIKIYQEGYFAYGAKKADNSFLEAGGGEFTLVGDIYTETLDFFTAQPDYVGQKFTYTLRRTGNQLILEAQLNGKPFKETWEQISNKSNALTGNWVITGRKRDGEISERAPGARRTIKILGGDRFQWVAFNSETREFMGSGGGTYTAENGKYTENITFFSRDNNRVGASLEFQFEVIDGKWHHSGISSKGDPIYEIWSDYKEAYLNK